MPMSDAYSQSLNTPAPAGKSPVPKSGTALSPYSSGFYKDPMTGKYTNSQTGQTMNEEEYNNMLGQQQMQTAQADEAKKNADAMAKQGLAPDGSPIRKAWDSLVDPATGKMGANYTMNVGDLDPSQWQGYQQYKQEAMRTGPSAWAQMQGQQQDLASQQQKNSAATQAMSGMNQANSNLAAHGGLSAGARALAARGSARDLLNARQGVGLANQTNKLGIATADEGNRIGQLANLAGTEQQIGQYNKTAQGQQQQFNIGNMLQEKQGQRAYNDLTYTEQMKKWAAGKTADATARSGGGGGKK